MNALKQLFNILNRRDRGICIDVKSWAMRNGFFVEVLRPSEQVTQRLPDKFPAGHSQFKKRHFFETNERFVAKIPKAQVVGPGFVILPDGRFAFDYQTHETRFITQHPTYFQRWRRNLQKTSLQGSYFSLLSRFCSEHYHWIHDALLQLHLAHEYLPGHVKYLVPRGLSSLQLDLLAAIGISSDHYVEVDDNHAVAVEELFFIPPTTITGFDESESARWLSARLRGHFLSDQTKANSRKLYISRSQASCRRVVNEHEILEALEGTGAERVCLEELDLQTQATLFAEATHIVAPHGAGLANLYFCNQGTKVLELFCEPIGQRTYYFSMSRALGLTYQLQVGKPVANAGVEPDIRLSRDNLKAIKAFAKQVS